MRVLALSTLACLGFAAASCAPVAQAPATSAPPPTSTGAKSSGPPAPAGTSAQKPSAKPASPSSSRSDSLPSPEAERVLATIAEPLGGSQQVPPDSNRRVTAVAPSAASDTLRVDLQEGNPSAPVPAPTPVTTAPAVTFAPPESTARATPTSPNTTTTPAAPGARATGAGAAAAAGAGAAAAPGASAAPADGTCWRVQVAAPEAREEAETKLAAAQSLLVVKMAITVEKGRYKVRTADCMTRDAADTVKRRAVESGFDGSFLVDTSAPAKPPAKSSRGSGH